MKHKQYGEVKIIGLIPRSRTIYLVESTDRGPGWDETSQSYKGVRNSVGWFRGENYMFGQQFRTHKKHLNG
jgi:hypothetical protein